MGWGGVGEGGGGGRAELCIESRKYATVYGSFEPTKNIRSKR